MRFFPADPRQALRLRRSLIAGGAALILTLIFWIAAESNLARLSPEQSVVLLFLFWAGNAVFLVVLRSGVNLRFQDPSLTLMQILWGIFWVMLLAYLLDEARPAALILCLLAVNFGAFRLGPGQLSAIAITAIAAYAAVIYLLYWNEVRPLNLQAELFFFSGFAGALIGTALVGREMFDLRKTIGDRNRELERALEQVNRLAVTDELTGTCNRRQLIDVLTKQVARADRGLYSFSVCFFDLDHFKKINDRLGHASGDEVLKRIAAITQRIIRDGDYLARYGGEEFVLVLVGTVVDKAMVVAERIRATIEREDFSAVDPGIRVTVSFGVTEYRRNEGIDAILARADNAMYQAKRQGRNAVVRA